MSLAFCLQALTQKPWELTVTSQADPSSAHDCKKAHKMAQIQGSMNKILESSGDILLKVWSDNGEMVPNASVDAQELNQHIEAYQKQLDGLELEIKQWLEIAKKKAGPAPADPPKESEFVDLMMEPAGQDRPNDDLGFADFLGDSQMDFMM